MEKLDLTSLRSAVQALADGIAAMDDAAWLEAQTAAIRNVLLSGVIRNFEFVYELAFKMIRRQLELEAASPSEVDESSFRDVVRSAAERGLLDDAEAWFGYHWRYLSWLRSRKRFASRTCRGRSMSWTGRRPRKPFGASSRGNAW
ncbi:MAG: nucleotidyltransferase substrate binding protein [Candidatus Binatia bacterium]